MTLDSFMYWNKRFGEVGDVGYADKLLFEYDERLRQMAILRAVSLLGLRKDARVLDAGCGTGRLGVELSKMALSVTGIDMLDGAVEKAKQRAEKEGIRMNLVVGNIVNAPLGQNYFDLITSVTVLQHITEQADFEQAVERIVDSAKFDGCILILEYSPLKCPRPVSQRPFYMAKRTRSEWIHVFSAKPGN